MAKQKILIVDDDNNAQYSASNFLEEVAADVG